MSQQNAEQIIATYQQMKQECTDLAAKINELDREKHDHKLVVDAISKLDSGRRCYRLVGGVLVERTVGEVVPAVQTNAERLAEIIQQMTEKLGDRQQQMHDFQVKHKIQQRGGGSREEKRPENAPATAGVLA